MSLNGQAALDWAKHEGEILDLFVTQSKTLNQVMTHMKEKHNFQATERQYKYRFPSLKNVKAKEWIWFNQEMQRRAAVGKESEPCLYGRPLPPDRVVREITRHQKNVFGATPSNQVPNPSPQRISVRTPPPNIAIHPELNLDPLDDLMDYNPSSCGPEVSVPESLAEQASFEVAFGQERLVEFDAAIAIEPELEDNLSHFSLPSEWTFDVDFSLATANRSSPGTIIRRTPSFSASSTPGLQFAGRGRSPFFQFVNLEIFDTRPNSHLMANLPWFRLQSILEQPEYLLQADPVLGGFPLVPTSSASSLPTDAGRDALWKLLGSASKLQLQENVPQVTSELQRLVPERYEGELSEKVGQLLNPRSTGSSSLWFVFGLAAYVASNTLPHGRMDTFLKWVIDQKYTHYLERLLQIDKPTIHAFAIHVLKSAVRIKNTKFLTALLDYGIKFDNILDDIFSIGDMDFTKLVFSRVDPTCYRGIRMVGLFHRLVKEGCFELARMLVQNGASVDGQLRGETLLYYAASRGMVHTVIFLLDLGANVNTVVSMHEANTALGVAAARKNPEIVALLLEHDASTSCKVREVDLLEWSSLHCRNIYSLLKENIGSSAVGVTIGDLVHAANRSSRSLHAYIHSHPGRITKHQFERALDESIQLGHHTATVALLQYGVSPDCHTLDSRPVSTALDSPRPQEACDLLIGFQATANVPGILEQVAEENDIRLLQTFVKAGVNLEEQGIEALVRSAYHGYTTLAAFLIESGVDVNTPGMEKSPLQQAAQLGNLEMIELLLSYGANINAPAYPRNGRTALQWALSWDTPPEVARFLLDKGADVSAPPALVGGSTALEAICHNCYIEPDEEQVALCNLLLDLGAPVNRPNGEPSSALHGAISQRWDEILVRMLEPQRNPVTNYMWCDMEMDEDEDYVWEPRTPTQLAAECGRLKHVTMLLDCGADINEAPAYRFGRTALQAAASNGDMELVKFLLGKGAKINANPAAHGGITALQGAAVSGDVMLAKLLLDKGVDVNAAPSFSEGRYAIEAASEHGRLDMVQLLLNAGAMGNVFRGTGFKYAIKLAEKNGHFAIASLLENVTQAQK